MAAAADRAAADRAARQLRLGAALARVLFAVLLAVVLTFALWPRLQLPQAGPLIEDGDVFWHIAAFAALTLPARAGWAGAGRVAAGLALCAGGVELAQTIIPGRTGSLPDMAAGLVGIGLGLLAASVLKAAARRLRAARNAADLRASRSR